MKVHVFQHVPFEDLGAMHGWFQTKGASVAYTRWFDAPTLPHDEPDLLVVLGGPMSVNDEALYPWLVEEKRYIAHAIEKKLPVLGVCLGAQLMASALGARVYPNPDKEIGWFTIQGTGASSLFEKELEHRVFQWHGETFDLPPGATLLARSDACENQAFSCGGAVVGLQFHLEVTPLGASALLEHCQGELVAGPYVQSAAQILTERKETYGEMHRLMGRVLTQVTTCAT